MKVNELFNPVVNTLIALAKPHIAKKRRVRTITPLSLIRYLNRSHPRR